MDPLVSKLLDFGAIGVMLAIALIALRQVSERLFNYMKERIATYDTSFLLRMSEHEKSAAERQAGLMKALDELVDRARAMNGKGKL